jgi:hypothetical protein
MAPRPHETAKALSDFDLGTRRLHQAYLLRRIADNYKKEGHKVFTEWQNLFALKGNAGTLSGKPDVVAMKGNLGWVMDTKTGLPKASDRIQVLIYMWALPKTNSVFKGVTFDRKVV